MTLPPDCCKVPLPWTGATWKQSHWPPAEHQEPRFSVTLDLGASWQSWRTLCAALGERMLVVDLGKLKSQSLGDREDGKGWLAPFSALTLPVYANVSKIPSHPHRLGDWCSFSRFALGKQIKVAPKPNQLSATPQINGKQQQSNPWLMGLGTVSRSQNLVYVSSVGLLFQCFAS